jgi:asparagine synthase (glutamine-hydrolysing)
MCGIYGIAGRILEGDRDVARAMDARLVHRGPDASGARWSPLGVFGSRRLSIIDLVSGDQPIPGEDGRVWVTCNGEIYNHRALREELESRGHRFATQSDTEVLVHAYEAYGDAFVERLRGMFALAIWDEGKRRVLLARDRIGKKPLYFSLRHGRLVYASELKAILADPGLSRTIDRRALWHYLSFKHVPAPYAIFEDVFVLPAGHVALFARGTLTLREYSRVRFTGGERLSEDEAAVALLDALEDAVRVRVEASDVPVGAFLSGGVDSSLVVALMARHAPKPLKTFSMGYAQRVPHKNDVGFARRIADEFATDHHELIVDIADVAEAIPRIVDAFDEPFGGTISPYWLSASVARDVKVALSGDGADELFGSYAAHRMAAVIAALRRGERSYGSFAHRPALAEIAAAERDAVWRLRFAGFADAEKAELLAGDWRDLEPSSALLDSFYRDASQEDLVNATLEVECRTFLPDQILTYVDRLSMAHSLEVRVPFLDQNVVAFAGRLPGSLKVRPDATKAVLKAAARRVLPADVVERPKEGFVLPLDTWLDRELRALAREAFSDGALRHGFFRRAAIDRLWAEHDAGVRDHTYKLWTLTMFQLWYRAYVEEGRYRSDSSLSRGAA